MSDEPVQIPEWVVTKVGALTLQLDAAQRRIADLDAENARLRQAQERPADA